KSLSGMGLPLAMVMIRPDLDVWDPGEHTGTFRGNNHAFICGTTALIQYWQDDALEQSVLRQGKHVRQRLREIVGAADGFEAEVRGRGHLTGLACARAEHGDAIISKCFDLGLLMETTGPGDSVVKVMPPLISTDDDIEEGLGIIKQAVQAVAASAA